MDSFLTRYRCEAGLTQIELSARSGLKRKTIQRLEAGFGLLLRSDAAELGNALRCTPEEIFPVLRESSQSKPFSIARRLDCVDAYDPSAGIYAIFSLNGGHEVKEEVSPATKAHLDAKWAEIKSWRCAEPYLVFNGLTQRVAINVTALDDYFTAVNPSYELDAAHNAECYLLNGVEKTLPVNPDEYLVDPLWDEYLMLGAEGDHETPLQNTFYDLIRPDTKWVAVTNTQGRRHILPSQGLAALCVSQTAFSGSQQDLI
ncbi:MAG: helix-turn-helix transcriptional regulator [Hyphomicrobiales bacterium]